MFRFIFCAVALTGFTATYEETSHCPDGKRHYRATVRHIERGGIGYEDGYTTAEVFFASDPSQPLATFMSLWENLGNNQSLEIEKHL